MIQEILGHSTSTITGNLYAHVLMGLKRQAAGQMDSALGTFEEFEEPEEAERSDSARLVVAR